MAARYGLQPRTYKRFPKRGGEEIRFDENKSPVEHVHEILENVCFKSGVSDSRKVQYLSALVKLLSSVNPRDGTTDLGLRIKEILLCLRIPLLSDNGDLRTATLRSVRYLVKNEQDVSSLIAVNLHLLIVRIIDLDSENRNERLQAVKLCKQLLMHSPQCFPHTLVKCIISLTQKGEKRKENFRRSGLALLCHLSCLNASLFVYTGCVRYICQTILTQDLAPSIIESAIGCLLRIYNIPWLRQDYGLDLSCLVGPFTELRLRGDYTWGTSEEARKEQHQHQIRINNASTALLSVLRSWSGILHINNPTLLTRPIQSLIEVLTIKTTQSRKIAHGTRILVLDIIFKSLNLQVPDWTEEFDVAMQTADPSQLKHSWKLSESFVAAEGRDIFPHLSKSRPNLVENHICLLLSCYLENKLARALVDVITSSDTVLSVRATVLLGELMHLVTLLLPREIGAIEQCLPELADYISSTSGYDGQESARAAGAVSALQRLHAIKKLGPRPQSLVLQQAVQFSGYTTGEGFVGDKLSLPAPTPSSAPQSQSASVAIENATTARVKHSQVIPNRDPQSWKWEAVMLVLRFPSDGLKRLEESNYKIFIKKLTDYFKPSSNMFSLLELNAQRTRDHTRIGERLVDFLVSSIMYNNEAVEVKRSGAHLEADSVLYLDELLSDVFVCIKEVIDAPSAHTCVFSPTRINNTACQLYFLFIGRLTNTEQGRAVLEKHDARSLLQNLLSNRIGDYLKLVVPCIDYRSVDWRIILSKAITSTSESGRLFTIRWLGVLARVAAPSFSQYGIEMLVEQLKDNSLQVSVAALTIVEEVCDDKMYLEALVAAKSSLLSESGQKALHRLGPRGRVLLTRFLGSSSGFNVMVSTDWLTSELKHWAETFNKKYVLMVEGLLNDCFSQHQRSLDGFGMYGRRSGDYGKDLRDAYVPPHLYGQLAQTNDGMDLLLKENAYWKMLENVRLVEVSNFGESRPIVGLLAASDSRYNGIEETWLEYKAAIWGLASVASSPQGIKHLEKQGIVNSLITIAETCQVLSLKGTAYYALGLVANTRAGSIALGTRSWATLRYSRLDAWPIAYDWWETPEDCLIDQELGTETVIAESENTLDDSWIIEDKPSILVQESRGSESRESSTKKTRRKKTVSECTDDSVVSHNILDPSPTDPPSYQMTGKFTDKITNWLTGTSSNGTTTTSKSEPRNSGSAGSRRFSDGGKIGSSFAKLRNSFRRRSKTLSTGYTPPEGTPASSEFGAGTRGETVDDEDDLCSVRGGGRKLSFGHEDSINLGGVIPASPETMPGEIFSMEKILEEPSSSSTPQAHKDAGAVMPARTHQQVVRRRTVSESHGAVPEAQDDSVSPSKMSSTQLESIRSSSQTGKEISGISCDNMDTSITSSTSNVETGSKETSRVDGTMMITFPAVKHDVHSSIKPGTSASSVSSYGSFSYRGVYDPYGMGSLARPRSKRRPHLSESEDGDNSVVSGSGHLPPLSRQDSKTLSTEYKLLRGTNTGVSKRLSVADPTRALSFLPRPNIHASRHDNREPSYWGLTFPLHSHVLYPKPIKNKPGSPSSLAADLPDMVWASLNSSSRHSATTCLACCRLQPSARPRAASLSITKDDLRSSLLVSGNLPSSQHSPESVKRKSWNPSLSCSNNQLNEGSPPDTSDTLMNFEAAKSEAMDLICQLNSLRYSQAEVGLNRVRGRVPKLFQDLCFYSDVCCLLGEYDYKANARKFIHQLFTPVNISQIENEAKNVINPGTASIPAPGVVAN